MADPEKSDSDSGFSSYGKALRTAGPLFTAGLQMAAGICLMGFLGYVLDRHWSTTPWLMVVGIFFGAGAGMYSFIRTVLRMNNTKQEEQ